jgi:hypothetical protein
MTFIKAGSTLKFRSGAESRAVYVVHAIRFPDREAILPVINRCFGKNEIFFFIDDIRHMFILFKPAEFFVLDLVLQFRDKELIILADKLI